MNATNLSFSTLLEHELFDLLAHAASGSSANHRMKRIAGLEEIHKRIAQDSIQDKSRTVIVLLDLASEQGNNLPESFLIADSLSSLVKKHEELYRGVLDRLGESKDSDQEARLFLCFSEMVLSLDREKKTEAIKPLVNFLMTIEDPNQLGAWEIHNCLVSLAKEKLDSLVVREASPFLESPRITTIVFSVRLCSKFADEKLLPTMLEVLQKSMRGYFGGHREIENDICQFLQRIRDLKSLGLLMKLLEQRSNEYFIPISKAMASILDAHPPSVNYVLDNLASLEHSDRNVMNAILRSFDEMNEPIDARQLLSKIPTGWQNIPKDVLERILVKGAEKSKPVLFDLLGQDDKYEFALRCLKEIGISNDELSEIFPAPIVLEIYNFFYAGKKNPMDLDQIWAQKNGLNQQVPGKKLKRLEHLLLHIFSSLNLVTLNVAPSNGKGVDIVCFYAETLDLLIIGCTTGTMKNDLQTMNSTVNEMRSRIRGFSSCSVTPIVVSSEIASIPSSDVQYAYENGIVIMQRGHIDTLLEMLNTNRQARKVIEFVKSIRHIQLF